MLRQVVLKHATALVAALLGVLFILMLDARLEARESYGIVAPEPGSSYDLPHPGLARFTTLGFHEAAADLAWLGTIIYFGEQATDRGRFLDFERYVDLVIALDPQFRRIYHWAGVLMIYSRAKIDRQMVEGSIDFLERGTERFPGDGEMHYMLGFNLYFEYPPFLGDDTEAKRRARLDGIDHFRAALASGTGPAWLAGMISNLLTNQGLNELAIANLEDALAVVEDPEARRKIIERIELLEKQAGPDSRAGMWERFEREWAASYGYLTMDMYLLVGPRPLFPPEAGIEIVKSREEDAMDVLDSMSQAP